MRFYGFEVNAKKIVRLEEKYLAEWGDADTLSETISEETLTEFETAKTWLSHLVTDPNTLTINNSYIPVTIIVQAVQKLVTLEYRRNPVTYEGVNIDKFVFSENNTIFELPINSEQVTPNNAYLMITTVYQTEAEFEQNLTVLSLQFSGNWILIHRNLK
jgi:hypothetical protein